MLRADVALPLFQTEHTMGSNDYCGIVEGMDALTKHLEATVRANGVDVRTRHTVTSIVRKDDGTFHVAGLERKRPFQFLSKRIVIATSARAYPTFEILKGWSVPVGISPLTRIYAIYPKDEHGRVWFHNMKRVVVDTILRHIIPIDETSGLIMISYTDGKDTEVWKRDDWETVLQQELRRMFPTKQIPEPTHLQRYEWPEGCTYWLPGTYNVADTSKHAHHPFENVYVCGESISLCQTWMEGALESAEFLLGILHKENRNNVRYDTTI